MMAWLTDVLERLISVRTKRHQLDRLLPGTGAEHGAARSMAPRSGIIFGPRRMACGDQPLAPFRAEIRAEGGENICGEP
jgi:hypothetical protein